MRAFVITPPVASRQLQLAAQAPYASFRNLSCDTADLVCDMWGRNPKITEVQTKPPEMYATEALQGGDASRKDTRRVGRRVESWFELSCVE